MIAAVLSLVFPLVAALPAATTAPAESPTDIRQVIERAVSQYKTASSYEDTMILLSELEADGPTPLNAPEPSESAMAFVRPGRLLLQTPLYRVISDGQTLWEVVDVWMQYSQAAAPEPLKLSDISLSRFGFFRDGKHPLAALVVDGDAASVDVLGPKADLDAIRAEPLDGAPGKRVTGTMGPGKDIRVEIWFDDADGTIREIVYDYTKPAQVAEPAARYRKVAQRMRFKNVRFGQPIPEARFSYKPDAYTDKVAKLEMPSAQEIQQRLVGKPAPAFQGKDLEGKSASMDDYKGRVVLLDFWSLRCGPCIMSMPALQRVADKYAEKPVNVVGVNLDGVAASASVSDVLKKQKVLFRNLIETQPSLAEKYFVEGIPCAVLIDGKGIVQSIHLGPANERDLGLKIDKLLKGEDLFTRK